MALYPTQTIALTDMAEMNLLNSSSALVIPLTILPMHGWNIASTQLSPTQDYSIRLWISNTPSGNFLPTNASYWHLNRYNDQQFVFYDLNAPTPSPIPPSINIFPVPLLPGNYFLNFLNLVNAENVFSFLATGI